MVQLCLNEDCVVLRRRYMVLVRKYEALRFKAFESPGWKGCDVLSIELKDAFWQVLEHRKVKETGKVLEIRRDVHHKNVVCMKRLLSILFEEFGLEDWSGRGEVVKELKRLVIGEYKLGYNPREFFGDRKEYFDKYYYPLKILDYFGIIEYKSNGSIRLTDYFFKEIQFNENING